MKISLVVLLSCSCLFAAFAESVVPEGKAADYYALLLKRPRPGYLFDRFFNSWLERADAAALETFLTESDDEMASALLAFYYDAVSEHARASALFSELIEERPDWDELLYYRAVADAELGAYKPAIEGLNELIERDVAEELELKALKLLGRSLLRDGREAEGIEAWERLLTASDMDPDVAEELLDMQLGEGLYEEALENCDQLMIATKDPYRKVTLLSRRSAILARMDQRDQAVATLREAFELTGEGSWLRRDALSRIERLYRGSDDLPGLRVCLDEMLAEWPGNPTLLKASAETARASGRDEEALEAARELVRLMPDARDTKDWYVDMLIQMGLYDEAIETLEAFVERYPSDVTLLARLADVNHGAGDEEKAREWVMAYLERSDKTEADYLAAARTLARFGQDDEATAVYLDMLNQWPNSAEGREAVATHMSRESYMHLNLAWTHYEWLAKSCDVETLTRLSFVLMAANRPERAQILLTSRRADFSKDYRYLTALFEATAAMKEPEGLLELGRERLAAAESVEDIELATAALVYEIKKAKVDGEWVETLSAKTDPTLNELWLLVALRWSRNEFDQADELLLAALEASPNDVMLLRCRLSLAKRGRDLEKAEAILTQLIEAYPTQRAMWIRELVPLLTRAGRTDDALEWIETWKTASPNATRPYELERDAYLSAGRADEAIEAMRRATMKFDESTELKLALGRLYESSGRHRDAERLYWRLLNAEETLEGRMARLSDLIRVNQSHRGLNDLISELNRRSENAPGSAFPLLGLAECYRINHQMNERAEVLAQVLDARPNDIEVMRAMADLKEDLGDYVAAREWMSRIAELDATGDAFARLAEFEAMYGDPGLAASMLSDPRVTKNADAFLKTAARMIAMGCLTPIEEPLRREAAQQPKDYRFEYLRARLLEQRGEEVAAATIYGALLAVKDERPGASASGSSSWSQQLMPGLHPSTLQNQQRMLTQWRTMYGAWISDELLQVYSMLSSGMGHYYMNRNSYFGGYRGSQAKRNIDLPDNLDELEREVLGRLRVLSPRIPEEARAELVAAENAKSPYIGLLSIQPNQGIHSAEWWSAAEALYPDSGELRLLRLLAASYSLQSEEEARQALAGLGEEHADLALIALSTLLHRYPAMMDVLPKYVGKVEVSEDNLTSITQLTLTALQQVSATNAVYASVVELFDEVERRNRDVDDVPQATRFSLAVARAKLDRDYDALLTTMEEWFFDEESAEEIRTMQYGMGGRSPVPRHHFAFPPHQLLDANPQGLYMLRSMGDEREDLKAAVLERPKDSLFRWLLLAHLDGGAETLDEAAEAVAARDPNTRDELFALAGWYSVSNELDRALGAVLELKERSDPAEVMSWNYDALILVSRMEELPEERRDELMELVEDLKKSSIWSDRSALVQLVDLLERLDVPLDEVTQLAKLGSTRSRSAVRRPARATRRPPDFYQQIRTAIDGGEAESALTRMAVKTRAEALREIHPRGGQSQNNYQLRNSIQYIQQRKFEDEFLACFASVEQARTARELFERAYALELLGRDEEALPLYVTVSERRPEWTGARLRCCIGLVESDPARARVMLSELPISAQTAFIQLFQQRVHDSNTRFEARLAMTEMALGFLASDETMDANARWNFIQNVMNSARNQWYKNNRDGRSSINLPAMTHVSEKGSLAPGWEPPKESLSGNLAYWDDEKLMEIQRRRRAAYLEVTRLAATTSQYGTSGFGNWTAYIDFADAPVESNELFRVARQVLKDSKNNHRFYSNSGDQGERQNPLDVYVMGLRRRADWSDAKVLMEETENFQSRYALKTLVTLNDAESDEQYMERFETALEAQGNYQDLSTWIGLAVRFHAEDERPGDLGELIWSEIDERLEKKQWPYAAAIANGWILARQELDSEFDVAGAYERLFDQFFTPAEREVIAAAAPKSIDHQKHQTLYMKYHNLSSVFNYVNPPPEAVAALLGCVGELDGKIQHGGQISRNLINRQQGNFNDVEWLERIGLFNDWDAFPFYVFHGGDQSMMRTIWNRLNGDVLKAITKAVNDAESRAFGVEFMQASAQNDWNKRVGGVIALLGDHAEELEAAPEERDAIYGWIQAVARDRSVTLSARMLPEGADEDAFAGYEAWATRAATREAEELEALKLSDFMRDSYQTERRAYQVVRSLVEEDPERAMKLFKRSRRLIMLARSTQGGTYPDQQMLNQMFSSATYTPAETRFALAVAADLDSSDADKWLSSQYLSQMFYRVEQRKRGEGLEYQAARLAAGKECLGTLLSLERQPDLEALLNCVRRVGTNQRGELGEWLAEQDFRESDETRILAMALDPKEADDAWLRTYLLDEEIPAEARLSAYSGLYAMNVKNIKVLTEPAVLFSIPDLLEADPSAKMVDNAYLKLVDATRQMEEGEEKERWLDRLLAMWKKQHVQGAPSNQRVIYPLVEALAEAGRDDAARGLLFLAPNANTQPATYAVAVRSGLDDFVTERLPGALRGMRGSYSDQNAWLKPEDAERRAEIAAAVEDETERLLVEIFLAALRVEESEKKYVTKTEPMEPLVERAIEELEDPADIRWVAKTLKTARFTKNMDAINQRFVETSSARDTLAENDYGLIELYIGHVNALGASNDVAALSALVTELSETLSPTDAQNGNNKRLYDAVVLAAYETGDPALGEEAIAMGVKLLSYQGRTPKPRRGDVLKQMGVVEIDPTAYGLDVKDDVERYKAYENYENNSWSAFRNRFNKQSAQLKDDPNARWTARRAVFDEWVAGAGEHGFMPLRKHIINGTRLDNAREKELEDLSEWLNELDETLMVDQLKACVAYRRLLLANWKPSEPWMGDLRRYLNRPDLDVAEKTRWLNFLKGQAHSLFQAEFERETLDVLLASESLAKEQGPEFLIEFPAPPQDALALYDEAADEMVRECLKTPRAKKRAQAENATAEMVGLLKILFALDRVEDARSVLNDEALNVARFPSIHAVAMSNGQQAWSARNMRDVVTWVAGKEWVADDPAIGETIALVKDPDVQVAARALFTTMSQKSDEAIKPVLDAAAEHAFTDPLCAVQVDRLLEARGSEKKGLLNAYAAKWFETLGTDAMVERVSTLSPLEQLAFQRHVGALIEAGRVDDVIAIYTPISKEKLSRNAIGWLMKAPFAEAVKLANESKKGPVAAPVGFADVDPERWLALLDLIEGFNGDGQSVMRDYGFGDSAFALGALAQRPETFQGYKRKQTPPSNAFELAVLYAGVHNGESDAAQAKLAVERYVAAMEWCKTKGSDNRVKRTSWENVARNILRTHPYRADKETWFEVLDELIPEELNREKLGVKKPEPVAAAAAAKKEKKPVEVSAEDDLSPVRVDP